MKAWKRSDELLLHLNQPPAPRAWPWLVALVVAIAAPVPLVAFWHRHPPPPRVDISKVPPREWPPTIKGMEGDVMLMAFGDVVFQCGYTSRKCVPVRPLR